MSDDKVKFPNGAEVIFNVKEYSKLRGGELTQAGKLELVMNLLNPVNEDDEPQEPLITPEQARKLLGFKDE